MTTERDILDGTTPTSEPMPDVPGQMQLGGGEIEKPKAGAEKRQTVAIDRHGLAPSTFEELWRCAQAVCGSGLAPRGLNTPEKAFAAMAYGLELGMGPMQALSSVAVINGTPSLFGDGLLACCLATGELAGLEDGIEGEKGPPNSIDWPDETFAFCKVIRCYASTMNKFAVHRSFSVGEAKRAGLWGKRGPWADYPERMLLMRARAYALRDAFADALKGFQQAETLADMQPTGGAHTEIVGDGKEF